MRIASPDVETVAAAPSRDAWLKLLGSDVASTVYLHPDLARARDAWYYARGSGDALSALAVLVPKELRIRIGGLPSGMVLRGRKVVGDRLLGDGRSGEAEVFLDEVARLLESDRAECVCFDDLEVGSPLWRAANALEASGRVRVFHHPAVPQPHWWIRFPSTPARYWERFSSKSRNTLRRRAKKLAHRLVRVCRPSEVVEFLRKAEHVSRRSWQGQRLGARVRNDERQRRFLTALAERGALRSYLLESETEPIAFLLGVQDRDRFRYEEVGFDGAYEKRSPGTVLLYRVLEDLLAGDCPPLFDFGAGDAGYKQFFGNMRTMSGPLVIAGRTLRPTAAFALDRAHRLAEDGARYLLRRTGLYQQVRRLYRRPPTS